MYQNMTREEMIQRLYEGNFTTGELERQLIAKLFEQCCGGSSGGGAFVVNVKPDAETGAAILDKTAIEIFEALKTMPVIIIGDYVDGDENVVRQQVPLSRVMIRESGYMFVSSPQLVNQGSVIEQIFYASNDNDYPTDQEPSESPDEPLDPGE